MSAPEHWGLMVAGGTGTRMGTSVPKQLLSLDGIPVMVRTAMAFLDADPGIKFVFVLHPDVREPWMSLAETWFPGLSETFIYAPSGPERTDSVRSGLEVISIHAQSDALVAIHDAVRPFVPETVITDAFAVALSRGSAIASVPVRYSLRKKDGHGSFPVDRNAYYEVQTPQVFRLELIQKAYARTLGLTFTDDASVMDHAGFPVTLVHGSYDNIKLTTPDDLATGEIILRRRMG